MPISHSSKPLPIESLRESPVAKTRESATGSYCDTTPSAAVSMRKAAAISALV
jgi:hypothetical protein